jgi:hypothetical protein
MMELAMQTMARIYLPLLRKSEWSKIHIQKLIWDIAHSLGDWLELHRRALSTAYATALCLDQPNKPIAEEDLEGRDPRW